MSVDDPNPYHVRTLVDWSAAVEDAGRDLPRPVDVAAVLAAFGGLGVVGAYVSALETIVRNVRAVLVRDFAESGIVDQAGKGPCTCSGEKGDPSHCDDSSCARCQEWLASDAAIDALWAAAQGAE